MVFFATFEARSIRIYSTQQADTYAQLIAFYWKFLLAQEEFLLFSQNKYHNEQFYI